MSKGSSKEVSRFGRRGMRRHELRDDQGTRIGHVLPGRPGGPGGVARAKRRFVNAFWFVAKTSLFERRRPGLSGDRQRPPFSTGLTQEDDVTFVLPDEACAARGRRQLEFFSSTISRNASSAL